MKKLLAAAVVLAAVILAGVRLDDGRLPSIPPWAGPTDLVCVEVARRGPDMVFTSPKHTRRVEAREVPFWHLFSYDYDETPVRVLGFLHGEGEDITLYASLEHAVEARDFHAEEVPRVSIPFTHVFPEATRWAGNGGRCARIEGWFVVHRPDQGAGVTGAFTDIVRVEVWSSPNRPVSSARPADRSTRPGLRR
jgi:hypothetical protein